MRTIQMTLDDDLVTIKSWTRRTVRQAIRAKKLDMHAIVMYIACKRMKRYAHITGSRFAGRCIHSA
jgi:hypothetical protein